jgi:hypothetical protein
LATGIPARLSPGEGRRFGLAVGTAFLALAGLVLWRGSSFKAAPLAALGLGLIAAGLLVPTRLGPVYRFWMALADRISRVTTPVFMGIIYFVVLTPTGLVLRLLGHNQLVRPRSAGSFWIARDPAARRRTDMARQF